MFEYMKQKVYANSKVVYFKKLNFILLNSHVLIFNIYSSIISIILLMYLFSIKIEP